MPDSQAVNKWAGDSSFQETWTRPSNRQRGPSKGGTLTFGIVSDGASTCRFAVLLQGRGGAGGACGLRGLGTGRPVDGVVASPGVGRIAAKGRGQFAPNFGCLLGWETGLQGGGPEVGISLQTAAQDGPRPQ